MKRRSFLTGSLAGAVWAMTPELGPFAEPRNPSTGTGFLKDAGAECGIKVGLQTGRAQLQFPDFVKIVKDNFNLMTPGNEFKWTRLRPTPDSFFFADTDWLVEFCESNRILVHGHNLCWNSPANPEWFKTVLNNSNASHYLTEHITTVMRRYAGRIDSWDVVNEPTVHWSKRADGLYPGIWLNLLGPQYIDIAFHAAAEADPKALLVLNVYDVEQGTAENETNRRATLGLLKELIARGVPVQAVGVESHLNASWPSGGAAYSNFLAQIRAMGLQTLFTELDVNDTQVDGNSQARDEVVAKVYQDYLTQMVPPADAKRIIFWTPSDKWDWLNSTNLPNAARADRTPHRPGLFDDAMRKKPAFGAVQSALAEICASATRR